MRDILHKISTQSQQEAIHTIIDQRAQKWSLTLHFLYFANVVRNKLFAAPADKSIQQERYRQALLQWDMLLPDGIALQSFYWCASLLRKIKTARARLPNNNGTDFTLPLLQSLHKKYGKRLIVSLYWWTTFGAEKATSFLKKHKITVNYAQDGYTVFDRKSCAQAITQQPTQHYHVLLVARGTPLQELWVFDNHKYIQEHNMLVLSVGWLFDFWSGEEKRTPKFFRWWAERLRRLCANPRKNAIKVGYSLAIFWYILRYLLLKR